jgi:hypothetical protein
VEQANLCQVNDAPSHRIREHSSGVLCKKRTVTATMQPQRSNSSAIALVVFIMLQALEDAIWPTVMTALHIRQQA